MKFSEKLDQKILQDNEPLNQSSMTLMSQATFNEDIINPPNHNSILSRHDSMSDPYQTVTVDQINPIRTPKSGTKDIIESYDTSEPMIDLQVQHYPDIIEQNMYYFDQFNK